MDNDVIKKMNTGLGIGLGLNVDDNQRLELLREQHRQDAENEKQAKVDIDATE
jgi:hypothetical protein